MKHVCPVCGYPKLKELPRSRDGGGSFEICPSCGFQFGVSDDDRGFTYEQWREKWRMEGMKWSSHRKVPRGWDPGTQVAKLLIVTMMFFSTVALRAGEQITCKSPDGKFALRQGLNDLNPIHGDAAIVETATKKMAVPVEWR